MPWSTEHSTAVAFSTVNPNVGDDSFVGPSGPLSIVTVGAASAGAACRQASSAATTATRSSILGVPTPRFTVSTVLPITCQPGLNSPGLGNGWATHHPRPAATRPVRLRHGYARPVRLAATSRNQPQLQEPNHNPRVGGSSPSSGTQNPHRQAVFQEQPLPPPSNRASTVRPSSNL